MSNTTKTQIKQSKASAFITLQNPDDWNYRFIRSLCDRKYRIKIKLPTKKTINFLDEIKFGESEATVRKILGEPSSVYQKYLSNKHHAIYTYRLRSGSNKLKIEFHFLEKSFFLGTVFFLIGNTNINDINLYFKNIFDLDFLHFKRDILVDSCDHFIEFHEDPNYFIMTYSKMNWINSHEIFQNFN